MAQWLGRRSFPDMRLIYGVFAGNSVWALSGRVILTIGALQVHFLSFFFLYQKSSIWFFRSSHVSDALVLNWRSICWLLFLQRLAFHKNFFLKLTIWMVDFITYTPHQSDVYQLWWQGWNYLRLYLRHLDLSYSHFSESVGLDQSAVLFNCASEIILLHKRNRNEWSIAWHLLGTEVQVADRCESDLDPKM